MFADAALVKVAQDLLGDDNEATVDGVHPTDLGFSRMAAVIGPVVREAIGALGNSL